METCFLSSISSGKSYFAEDFFLRLISSRRNYFAEDFFKVQSEGVKQKNIALRAAKFHHTRRIWPAGCTPLKQINVSSNQQPQAGGIVDIEIKCSKIVNLTKS